MRPRKKKLATEPGNEKKPRFRIERLEERIAPTHKGVGHGKHQPSCCTGEGGRCCL